MLGLTLGECSQSIGHFLLLFLEVKACTDPALDPPEETISLKAEKKFRQLPFDFEVTLNKEWAAMKNHIAYQKVKEKGLIKQLT